MTKKELIEALKEFPDDIEIYIHETGGPKKVLSASLAAIVKYNTKGIWKKHGARLAHSYDKNVEQVIHIS